MANDHVERGSGSGELRAWEREIGDDLRGVEAVKVVAEGERLWQVGAVIDPLVERAPTHLEGLR